MADQACNADSSSDGSVPATSGEQRAPDGAAVTQADSAGLRRAGDILRAGGLVAFPTETVYGLGADASNASAVARIFEAKGRPRFDPLIVHLASAEAAWACAATVPTAARQLAAAFWPGPLTLVLPRNKSAVADLVTAGLDTVALRVPGHPVARSLIESAGVAIAAPSANRFGGVSPTTAAHVAAEFPGGEATGPKLILDGGPCETGVESTVISLTGDRPAVLRLGGLAVEQIEAVVGPVTVAGSTSRPGSDPESASKAAGETANDAAPDSPPASPGMLDRHYAPSTRLAVVEAVTETVIERYLATADHPGAGASESAPADAAARSDPAGGAAPLGLLLFAERPELAGLIHDHGLAVEVLSERGEPREAAARLFAAMRSLDARGVRQIVAEWAPEHGLGRAINDRLKRAAR